MNNYEQNYSAVMAECLKKGIKLVGRNGRIRQISNVSIKADLKEGFPIVTGKQIFPNSCFVETEWLLKGYTNIKWLNERGVHIWDQWADENGDLGPVYGKQLLNFNGVNQIKYISEEFGKNRFSRRLVCNMWNPNDINKMALPPCHYSFQFLVYPESVDIVVTMRSLDLFVGLPYDMVMYASILKAFCFEHNIEEGSVFINAASGHVYEEHVNAAATYIGRKKYDLPKVDIQTTLSNFDSKQIVVSNYKYQERLKVNVIK